MMTTKRFVIALAACLALLAYVWCRADSSIFEPTSFELGSSLTIKPGVTLFIQGTLDATDAEELVGIEAGPGGESPLTFAEPLVRVGDDVEITLATTSADGYLSSTDWDTFNDKVSATRSITTTSPLSGGGDLSANRTLTINQATTNTNGYLNSTDWNTFNGKMPGNRTITATAPLAITGSGILSADRTMSMPAATDAVSGHLTAADHEIFSTAAGATSSPSALGGAVFMSPTADPPINRVNLGNVLTSAMTLTLPPAANYAAGAHIDIVDIVGGATVDYPLTISRRAAASDFVDGGTDITLPQGSAYARMVSNGSHDWYSTTYHAEGFRDGTGTMLATPEFTGWITGPFTPTTFNVPNAPSTLVIHSTGEIDPDDNNFVYDVNSLGEQLRKPVPDELPDMSDHEAEVLTVEEGVAVWKAGGSNSEFVVLDGTASPVEWDCITGQLRQNAVVELTTSATLKINNAVSGMHFNLYVKQDATGGRALLPPEGSLTDSTSPLGVLPTPTPAALQVDFVEGDYIGKPLSPGAPTNVASFAFKSSAQAMASPTPTSCSVANTGTMIGATTGTSTMIFNDATGSRNYVANQFVATNSTLICTTKVHLLKNGSPNYTATVGFYDDAEKVSAQVTDGVTNGTATVTAASGVWVGTGNATDVGQEITGTDIPAHTYIGVVNSPTSIGLSSVKGSNVPVSATGSHTGITLRTYGTVGTLQGTISTQSSMAAVPIYLNAAAATTAGFTGAPNAVDNPTDFSGIAFTPTSGNTYYMVVHFLGLPSGADYISLLYSPSTATGYKIWRSTSASSWNVLQNANRSRWTSYH